MSARTVSERSTTDLHGSRWLILHGEGEPSASIAREIAATCAAAGVRATVAAIAQRGDHRLRRFTGLVVVLPTPRQGMQLRAELDECAKAANEFSRHAEYRLKDVLSGSVDDVSDIDFLSLVGARSLMHHAAMRTAVRNACAVHYVDVDTQVDIFRPYVRPDTQPAPATPWENSDNNVAGGLLAAWSYLCSWGLTDTAEAAPVLACIERCRQRYEDPSCPSLHRPVPGHDLNRLDFILDEPPTAYGTRKTWNENGARVWREVYEALQATNSKLSRPGNSNRKGAQADLRRLYENLTIIVTWRATEGRDMSALPDIG